MDLMRSRRKSSTRTFERDITAQYVDGGPRLVLGVLHMGALEDVPGFVRSLIAVCRSVDCNIRAVLLDCEFFSTRVFEALGKMSVGYLVPCRNTDVVVDAISEFAAGRRPVASELCITNADGVSVRYAIIITERKKRRKKSGKEKSDGEDLAPEEKFIGFVTNMQLKDSERYLKRVGIKTGYRMMEEARARTRSTKTVSRIFCFLYSVTMFNAWVRINAMLCRVRICQKDRETHDADAITNLDSGGACPARAGLQNTAGHRIATPILNICGRHQTSDLRDAVSDVQAGHTEEPFIFKMPDTCTVSGKLVCFLKNQTTNVQSCM